ncbi:MAG: APC family permease, partial [Gammaproteobacteria bacterium]|nr:APC family permease [Gammaproteobacteria bacterium]
PDSAPLKRVIGVASLGLNTVNLTIAAGIFGLPAIIAGLLGAQAILAYLVCAALFGLVGLCLAEAGSRVGRAGGLYAYASVPFGPIVGGIAGTLLWTASGSVADAAIVNLLVDTLAAVIPPLHAQWARVAIIVALFTTVALINVRGVTHGVRLSIALTIIKIAPLALLVIGGLFALHPANLAWVGAPPLKSIGQAAVVLFYAFIGVEAALNMSGEVIRPSRTVPRGILLGLTTIGALYMGLQLVAQGTLGAALAASQAPLVDTANVVFGHWGGRLMVLAVAISASGCLAADMLSTPRVLHAFAVQRQLPMALARVHPRFGTPWVAIATYATVCAVFALTGTFKWLAIMSSSGTLLLYLICCLGVLRLRARNVAIDGAPFTIPFGPLVPVAACVIIVWMLSTLAFREIWFTLAAVSAVGIVYAFWEYWRTRT